MQCTCFSFFLFSLSLSLSLSMKFTPRSSSLDLLPSELHRLLNAIESIGLQRHGVIPTCLARERVRLKPSVGGFSWTRRRFKKRKKLPLKVLTSLPPLSVPRRRRPAILKRRRKCFHAMIYLSVSPCPRMFLHFLPPCSLLPFESRARPVFNSTTFKMNGVARTMGWAEAGHFHRSRTKHAGT